MNSQLLRDLALFLFSACTFSVYLTRSFRRLLTLNRHIKLLYSGSKMIHKGILSLPSPIDVLQRQDIINQLNAITLSYPQVLAAHQPALYKVGDITVYRNPNLIIDDSLYEKIQQSHVYPSESFNYFYPIAYLLKPFFSGFKIGHLDTLLSLKSQPVYLIGEVSEKLCEQPMALVSELSVYVGWIRAQIVQKIFANFFWGFLLGFVITRGVITFKEYRGQNQQVVKCPGEAINLIITNKLEDFKCGICQKALRNRVCLPCGHLSLCEGCLPQQKCPFCQKSVQSIVEIFIP